MLGRLLKHEFISYRLSMGIIFLAGALLTAFMKILSMLPYNDNAKDPIQILMVVGFVMIMFVISIAVQVMIVIRFYSTTASDQAYLTWTLPAKTSTIIWSKLLAGIFWRLICVALLALLVVIFFSGKYWLWHEELQGLFFYGELTPGMMINEMMKNLTDNLSSRDVAGFIIYYIGVFIWSIAGILLIYMCIGIGQLFGKYRVLASIGFYFLIMIIVQIVSTIAVAFSSVLSVKNADVDSLSMSKYGFYQSITSVILAVVVSAVVFAITNYLFDKHLNLD